MTSPSTDTVPDQTLTGLLARAGECEAVLREVAVHQVALAYEWAIAHPVIDAADTPSGPALPDVLSTPELLGGDGTPAVAAFTAEPFAVACGIAPSSATALLADALDLHHRLPVLWHQTQAGTVAVWKARRVASHTRHLSLQACLWVDRHTAGRVSSLGLARLDRTIAEAAARIDGGDLSAKEEDAKAGWDVQLKHRDPARGGATSELHAVGDTLDLTRFHDIVCAEAEALGALGDHDPLQARKAKALGVIADAQARLDLTSLLDSTDKTPGEAAEIRRRIIARRDAKIRLYLHASLTDLATGGAGAAGDPEGHATIGTIEGLGPVTVAQVRQWVGAARVSITPVVHSPMENIWSVDRHDPSRRMTEQVVLTDPVCVFPWCNHPARQSDLDHIDHYVDPADGGPPGQTRPDNLAPVCRRHHRAKTSGQWSYERTAPGTYLWHGPGTTALVTPTGTITLPTN